MTFNHRNLVMALGVTLLGACAADVLPEDEAEGDITASAPALFEEPPYADPNPPVATVPRVAPDCSPATAEFVRARILPTTPISDRSVSLTCNLKLSAGQVVEKRIILEGADASGVTIDCGSATLNGGVDAPNDGKDMIEVKSKGSGETWSRPSNITIRNCNILGSMRIYGRGKNGEAPEVRESSRRDSGHVARLRSSAPTRILLDHLTITATARTPLYLSPGVTYVTMQNSELKGNGERTALYLDAESAYNTFRNNSFHVKIFDEWITINRLGPQVSIDTSSYNKFINNDFSALEGGGIHTFRNCGEGGTVRHGSSNANQIINNVFYYNVYAGLNASVHLGSRGEWYRNLGLGHCDDDEGAAFTGGSADSNDDYSRYNVVMQNQVYKRPVEIMLREGDDSNRPNYFAHNETVTTAVKRFAGCYVANGYKNFIRHGERLDLFRSSTGAPTCTGYAATCNDGELSYATTTTCGIQSVPFACQANSNNAGCAAVARCPLNRKIVAAKGACNLEYGTVSDAQLSSVPWNNLSVVRASDTILEGLCWMGTTRMVNGQASVTNVLDSNSAKVGCSERNSNGGDCHIRGVIQCH